MTGPYPIRARTGVTTIHACRDLSVGRVETACGRVVAPLRHQHRWKVTCPVCLNVIDVRGLLDDYPATP